MDATLLASLTANYPDVTSWGASSIATSKQWSKLYGAGVILYKTEDKNYLGTYRATVNGADWGTFKQTGYNQPDPGEVSARAWIDANTPLVSTPVTSTSTNTNTSTTTNTVLGISPTAIIVALGVLIVVAVLIWPRRKTVFDTRRKR
ncbi:hypothetical protein M0R72_06070 [Candidatus Pacearchaeota archaeon]|jgi:hypothetical protein|nr:hypothetical protein [Candidatus Pacearchaeota archaeon]